MTAKDLLRIMPDALDPAAAGDTAATIQYELSEPVHHVLQAGSLRTVEGRADRPDLTVTVDDADFVRLFRGQLDPLGAFLSGRVRVTGNMGLAQRLLGLFDRDKLSSVAKERFDIG